MDGKQTPSEEPSWQFKPGETISPRAEAPASPAPIAEQPQAAVTLPPSPAPAPPPQAQPAPVVADSPPMSSNEAPPYTPSTEGSSNSPEGLTWTASEFIAHDKSAGWHVGLIAVSVVAAAILWFITRDIVTSIVVIVAGGVLSLYGARRPGELQYQLDNQGISIGPKHYSFSEFRAFSLVPEGAFASIALLPTKRFAPMTTLYFAPEDGDKIIDILGGHLPEQPMKIDAIDSLMRRIRF